MSPATERIVVVLLAVIVSWLVGYTFFWLTYNPQRSVPMPQECRGHVVCVIDETGAHPGTTQ
jgi:FlaG/FlaF family flagellin (archaellin)